MAFNPNDYATVEERLALFWAAYPDGRVTTEIVVDDGTRILIRSCVYRHRDDLVPTSTGYAEEIRTKSGINSMSAVEVCETSSLGRALANYRFQAKKRPSRLEMQKPDRMAAPDVAKQVSDIRTNELVASVRRVVAERQISPAIMRDTIETHFGGGMRLADMTADQLQTLLEVMP